MKKLIKVLFEAIGRMMGFYVKPFYEVRFGVEWNQDIRYLLNGKDLELVIDVGANIGQTVHEVLKYFPKTRIYCFEPVPSTFEELTEETRPYPNVFPFNIALGDEVSTLPMTARTLAQQNTLVFNADALKESNIEIIEVQVDTLDQFCLKEKINRINLLKIDTEGYEMKVLKGAEKLLSAGRIDYLIVECDFFKRSDQPHGDFVEILNYLQPLQYNVVALYTAGVDNSGWVWGDVLFGKICNEEPGFSVSPFFKP